MPWPREESCRVRWQTLMYDLTETCVDDRPEPAAAWMRIRL